LVSGDKGGVNLLLFDGCKPPHLSFYLSLDLLFM
jgi:hypothetical protein